KDKHIKRHASNIRLPCGGFPAGKWRRITHYVYAAGRATPVCRSFSGGRSSMISSATGFSGTTVGLLTTKHPFDGCLTCGKPRLQSTIQQCQCFGLCRNFGNKAAEEEFDSFEPGIDRRRFFSNHGQFGG